ncbi:unnamed protein product [Acanthoscelides obtectus]|uniref:Uncharacterized protein n=1 Tax=Acanthoscelides obtectus TaxID=200917 RepID=A0A9P0PPH9_ACAOB|nr:unnamed protein product [Acanthoscelides obtectus]CAK1664946.1 hypothetical protein AOBTE_LOCUS24570 [Acanthoscelides obtectus]
MPISPRWSYISNVSDVSGYSGTSVYIRGEEEALLVNKAFQNVTNYVYRKPNPYPQDTKRLGIIVLIFCIAIPVVKIIIGITHRNECDTNKHIPTLLYITGFLQVCFAVTFIVKFLSKMIFQLILGVGCVTMFLIGSVGTFIEYQPDYYKGSWRYCDYNLYMFAFFCYIAEYLMLAVVVLYVCIMFAFYIPDE